MANVIEIDMRELSVTPFFKVLEIENIPKSEAAGHAVMEMREVVEIRLAGSNNYAPVMPTDSVWRREGNKAITYAERWAEQYSDFKDGDTQKAIGTPLEMLRPYGVSQEQISICRARRVYSIEAVDSLEGDSLKSLGMHGNALKDAARKYLESRRTVVSNEDEVEALKRRIAELEAQSKASTVIPDVEEELIEAMTDDELREYIGQKTGSTVNKKLDRDALINMAKGM